MKKKTTYILAAMLAASSCSYLEFDETNGYSPKEDIYKYFDKTKEMLTNVYSYIPQDFGSLDGAMRDCASDDAIFGNTGAQIYTLTNSSWSAVNTYDNAFSLYSAIRSANDFMDNVEGVDLSRFSTDANYENWMAQLKYFGAEARALRAFYFFELAKRYGDIPMPLKVLTVKEVNDIPKTPFDDVVTFIAKECDECAAILPASYQTEPYSETGRVTKGFCIALKTKALLYAASPLHNGNGDTAKWKRAALAAKELIDLNLYSLDRADKCNNLNSPENIFVRINDKSSSFENVAFPLRFMQGKRSNAAACIYPTQNLVDAFQTVNGHYVELKSGGFTSTDPKFDPKKPYSNRDPRLARTVLTNGAVFKGSVIETFNGGKDAGEMSTGATPTGYYLKKYVIENTSFDPNAGASFKHHWVVFRYAEILLSYAEAMVGTFGSPDYKDSEFTMSAAEALNMVRANAGMPAVTTKNRDKFTDELRNEWRVEFAFEDHRFWDVRRWKTGAETQREIYGVEITVNSSASSYRQVLCQTRFWHNRMLLYPIPQTELTKNEKLKPQNAGW